MSNRCHGRCWSHPEARNPHQLCRQLVAVRALIAKRARRVKYSCSLLRSDSAVVGIAAQPRLETVMAHK